MTYAFGGSDEYHGKDMWRAHEKLVREKGLNDHHFNVIVKHLVGALQSFNVPEVKYLHRLLMNARLLMPVLLYFGSLPDPSPTPAPPVSMPQPFHPLSA